MIRTISVLAPLKNEASNVDGFVHDIAAQDFDGDVEVLVADGNSQDGSAERLTAAAKGAGLNLRVLKNPAGLVSHGLNACIREARGDLLVRLDCHSRYPSDYLRRCAEVSDQTGAWNVGGRLVPTGTTPAERAVACAMDSPFGGIGWTRVAESSGPVETDTVTFGAFRPEAFKHAGLFDETLVRNQDDEFNVRLRRAGGHVLLDPDITVRYRPRGSLAAVWRQYYEYGLWKVPIALKHRRVPSMRSLTPLAFVLANLMLLVFPRSPLARRLLAVQWALYGVAGAVFGARTVRKHNESWSLMPRVLASFPVFHLSYGLGQTVGWLRALGRCLR